MRITLSQFAGFCDGVKRAYEMIEKLSADPAVKRPIVILGSLVHNDDVMKRVAELGIEKRERPKNLADLFVSNALPIGTLAVTAHGMGPEVYELAKRYKVPVVDATCPRVTKVQRLGKIFAARGSQIVIVGERDHKEVKGINEWAGNKAVFVEIEGDLARLALDSRLPIAVISQTTQNRDFVDRMAAAIKKRYPEAETVDTICFTTHQRQEEIKKLARTHDAVVVIGSPTSSNSTRLYEIAKEINPRSYFIERVEQLDEGWFKSAKSVAVTAGASTPEWIIEEVMDWLRRLVVDK